jgi:hypothetical protein
MGTKEVFAITGNDRNSKRRGALLRIGAAIATIPV